MSDRRFLKPAPAKEGEPARLVRKPSGQHLAADGEPVLVDSYWRRRMTDGDVVEAEPPAAPSPSARKQA